MTHLQRQTHAFCWSCKIKCWNGKGIPGSTPFVDSVSELHHQFIHQECQFKQFLFLQVALSLLTTMSKLAVLVLVTSWIVTNGNAHSHHRILAGYPGGIKFSSKQYLVAFYSFSCSCLRLSKFCIFNYSTIWKLRYSPVLRPARTRLHLLYLFPQ
jgi:hypothetical protein